MSTELFNLKGKSAIVVGGSKGLGKGMATALSSAGANVVIASRSQSALNLAAKDIEQQTENKILPISFDVSKEGDTERLAKQTLNEFGSIDILVNSAGMNIRKPAEDVTKEDWDTLMEVQLKGVFFTCQEVGKIMIKQKKGKIINLASLTSKLGLPNMIAYCAAKGGIVQMTRALATEWAKYNINVNAIGPGYYKTEQTKALFDDKERLEGLLRRIPMGRTGLPEDLAGAVIFLSSEASNYLTGQTIYVDGGWLSS